MNRTRKKEIALNKDSVLGLMQEIYNELVEQRATAIRAGGSTQSRELTQQAEQTATGGLATADKLKKEADKLLSQAKQMKN